MGSIYLLTLRQLSGRWRLTILTVLAALPVLITWVTLHHSSAPTVQDFEKIVYATLLAGAIMPLAVLAIGSAAFGNEVDDRTLANLTLAPIARWQIVVPKLLATLTIATPFIAVSAGLVGWMAYLGDMKAVAAMVAASIAGVALYASAFLWLGLVTSQAIGIGLLYIVLWEGFFAGFVSGVRLLSIRHYAIALMHGMDARRFADGTQVSPLAAAVVALVVFTGFVWLAVRRLRAMDVA